MEHQYGDGAQEDGIGLQAIIARLWQGWRVILLFGAAFFLLGVLYLHLANYTYTATLVVVPTQGQNQSGGTGQLGSLASLAGIDIGGSQNVSPFTLYPDVMKTRIVSDTFVAKYPGLMHQLFADQWDAATDSWKDTGGLLHQVASMVKGILGYPPRPWMPPGAGDVQQVVTDKVQALLDSKKPVLTITFNHRDPVFARNFLQALHESADQVLRRQTLDRSTKYAHYLEQELQKVQLAEVRQVLTNSLSQQETLVMMSNSNTPFAAQPVGNAISSMRPTNPRPVSILLAALLAGFFCGGAWAYFGLPMPRRLRGSA